MPHQPSHAVGGGRAWFVWSLAALSFAYAYFQRVAPSVMVQDLMREFAVGGAILGNLSAIYFYAYAGLQLPVGILVDRWGPRVMIAAALLLASGGSLIFALAESVETAYFGRLLVGTGSAFSFVGALMLASRWFAPNRFALLSGLTMLVAMASAIGSQAPLAAIVETVGWRATMLAGSAAAFVIALGVIAFVRDRPPHMAARSAHEKQSWAMLLPALGRVVRIAQVWNAALLGSTMSAAMLSFGGLWGVPYLMARYGLPRAEAAFYCSFMFFGWALGAPFAGWLADRIGRRKAPLVAAAAAYAATLTFLFTGPDLPPLGAALVIALAGAAGSFMINCYAYAREITEPGVEGAVTGFINTFSVGSGALFQPLIGALLDLNWSGGIEDGSRVYSMHTYTLAMTSLIAAAVISLASALCLKETFCRGRGAASLAAETI